MHFAQRSYEKKSPNLVEIVKNLAPELRPPGNKTNIPS